MEESSSDLEQFRRAWKEEVNARSLQRPETSARNNGHRRESTSKQERPAAWPPSRHPLGDTRDEHDGHGDDFNESQKSAMIERIEGLRIRDVDEDDFTDDPKTEPSNALEHYERAVEKESQGNLGDSLSHYRQAYRLDAKVDQSYRAKHFPGKSKPTNPNPSNAPVTVPNPAHHSLEGPTETVTLTTPELIASFADARILTVEPLFKGDKAPPCPVQKLPTEVMLELLRTVGTIDPAILARLSRVCKRFAYHVCTENALWKRLALGPEFGLASQQYNFVTDLQGREAIFRALESDEDADYIPIPNEADFEGNVSWREVFQSHPRIRFSGAYISTVNYTRAGGASATQFTWNSAIHIVTYYRYLRFCRDGTCISLLTTHEPTDVVHHLTRENLNLVRSSGKGSSHPHNFTSSASAPHKEGQPVLAPTAQNIMKHALRGRWRLCHPSMTHRGIEASAETQPSVSAGDIHIETEGAGPRYIYTMHLSMKSTSKAKTSAKNNKLQWQGFWSYNTLTNDWAEFQLKNDKAFYFSRVKSYGLGY